MSPLRRIQKHGGCVSLFGSVYLPTHTLIECRVCQRAECLTADVTAQRGGVSSKMFLHAFSLKWYLLYLSNSKQAWRLGTTILHTTKLFVWRHVLNADFYYPITDGCFECWRSHSGKQLWYLIRLEALDVRLRLRLRQFCFDVITSLWLIVLKSHSSSRDAFCETYL
jgi:hypothetical protein